VTAPYFRQVPADNLGYVEIDRRSLYAVTPAASGAGATIYVVMDPVGADDLWEITRFTVSCTSSTPTTAAHYVGAALGDATAANLLEGTSNGNLDFADEAAGVQLEGSRSLLTVWTGASSGAIGTVRIQYKLYRRRGALS